MAQIISRPAGLLFLASLLVVMNVGVGCIPPGSGPEVLDGNVGVKAEDYPGRHIQGEPNEDFDQSIEILFDGSGRAALAGTISSNSDVDVYTLGPLQAGDRLIIDVGHSGDLDAAMAIFDVDGEIAFENDDRDLDLGQLDPFLNAVIRHDSPVYYLAITSAPLGPSTGGYHMNLNRVLGGTAPLPLPQTVILNFAGGTVTASGETYTVGPFDTADIWPAYTGMTAWVQAKIADTVRKDFEGLNLIVEISPPAVLPSACTASVVYFGGYNPQAFGTSQQIDPYNASACDASIIFTQMFTPSRFGRVLTGDELGLVIGRIATHEIGHLLGLNHVANVVDIMDTTGGPETFFNQGFMTSELDWTIFPIGSQNAVRLLLETLGGTRTE